VISYQPDSTSPLLELDANFLTDLEREISVLDANFLTALEREISVKT
jgi:hypothetical protein